ncbi:unnamed protein product, partial [Rotaria sp. Silwood2]
MRHFEEESKKWKIYEKVASRKEQDTDKDGDDIVMKEVEEIPQARPRRERYSRILDMTISDSDSQGNENSHTDNKGEASAGNSETEEDEDKKKRKLKDTSISPTSKDKIVTDKNISIRKPKPKSKKKKEISIENDPRAPEGSPVLVVSEGSKEVENRTSKNSRPDPPIDPSAKRRRLIKEIEIVELPKTPPGLGEPPTVSPRQSTPRTPIARPQPLDYSPNIVTSNIEIEEDQQQEEVVESIEMVEQDKIVHSPSVISKEIDIDRLSIVNFPIIPIECKFHFKIFHQPASVVNIIAHREFLEKKAKQQQKELEQHMEQYSEEIRKIVVQYIKNSIDPLIDNLKNSNQKRLDNLILDQIKEKALRIIRSKNNKNSLELVDKAQATLERTLELKFQLDKLDRRLNENMPPPALNIMDKLQFRSKVLSNENKEQYSEQWNNVIRKSKLDLTSIMRLAKLNHHHILSSRKELTMSSITIIPRTYSSTTSSNLPNINIPPLRPAYLNPNPIPRTIPPTYQHIVQQIQRKPALYGSGQRKYNNFHKFQIGTTTTFNGYTNYNGSNNINVPPIPAPRRNLPPIPPYNNNNNNSNRYQQQNYNYNRYNNYRKNNFYNNNNNNNNARNLPSLLDINPFHLPSQHNTRSLHHAQQYHPNQQYHQHLPRPTSRTRFHLLSQLPSQSRSRSRSPFRPPPIIKPRRTHQQQNNNNNINNNYNNNNNNFRRPPVPVPNIYNNNNKSKGIILSDSMCSRVRTYALKNNYVDVELSYESGCDIVKMINWLQTPEGQRT